MDEWIREFVVNSPAMGVVVVLVVLFLRHQSAKDTASNAIIKDIANTFSESSKDSAQKFTDASSETVAELKELNRTIGENSAVISRATNIMEGSRQ